MRTDRLRGIVARCRHTGYAETGILATGPAWCWLTMAGMKATGLSYPATHPALGWIAIVLSLLVLHLIPGQSSGPAVVTGLITWFGLTARGGSGPATGR